MRRAILRLRGLFVKAGQLASVLTTVLPEAFRVQLDGLQDRVPAGPFASVRARIVTERGLDALRVSTHIFNSAEEVDRLLGAVATAARDGVPG